MGKQMAKRASRIASVLGIIVSLGAAAHSPANKITVAASTVEVMETQLVAGSSSQTVTLLSTTLKTSTPSDLSLSVHAECGIGTDVQVVGSGISRANASVKVWVEVDGVAVPVSPQAGDDGKIVFCNRDVTLEATVPFLDLFENSRSANAFQWVDLDVGNQIHTVEVKARLEAHVTGIGRAKAAVGRRTLVIEPVQMPTDHTF